MISIGVFGGSFDPITIGHIEVANYILDHTPIKYILLVPCYSHRFGKVMSPSNVRLKMCKLVCKDFYNIKISNFEIKNKLSGSTYEFMIKFKQKYKDENFNFFNIIGMDNANDFMLWHNYDELINSFQFIVVPRKGLEQSNDINWYLKGNHIFLDKCNVTDISSTKVRDYLNRGEFDIVEKYLYPSVFEFIKRKKLYHKK